MIVAILTTVSVSLPMLVVPPTAVIVTVILTVTVTVTVTVILTASADDCVRMCSQGGLVSPVRPPARRLAPLPCHSDDALIGDADGGGGVIGQCKDWMCLYRHLYGVDSVVVFVVFVVVVVVVAVVN